MKMQQTIEETRARRSRHTGKRGGEDLLLQLITDRDRGPFSNLCEVAVKKWLGRGSQGEHLIRGNRFLFGKTGYTPLAKMAERTGELIINVL